jgi:hypothetical protein
VTLPFPGAPKALHPASATAAIIGAHPLIQGAWVHEEGKRAIIELWWHRPPTPEERTETARAAVQTWLAARGTTREDWESLRVRAGREKPETGRLGRLRP